MPLNTDELRHLLTERGEPASIRPVPHERIQMRIRQARVRRAAAVGLAASVTIVSVLGIVTALHRPSSDQAAAGQPFPASFTASGGISYWPVAITSLTLPAQQSTIVTVRHGSYPLEVMTECGPVTGHTPTQTATTTQAATTDQTATNAQTATTALTAQAAITVNGTQIGELSCPGARQLIAVPGRLGGVAAVTFTKITLPELPDASFSLRFAVYKAKSPVGPGSAG